MQGCMVYTGQESRANNINAGMDPYGAVIVDIADNFCDDIHRLSRYSSTTELRTAIRSHISMLEEFCSQM